MIYEEQLPRAIWTRNFRKHILCGGAGSVGALPERRRAAGKQEEEGEDAGMGRGNTGRVPVVVPDRSQASICRPFGQDLNPSGSSLINFKMQ